MSGGAGTENTPGGPALGARGPPGDSEAAPWRRALQPEWWTASPRLSLTFPPAPLAMLIPDTTWQVSLLFSESLGAHSPCLSFLICKSG